MSWGVLNAAMLLGLLGVALPVLIHLLNRRRDPVIDWGAMQFLELGRRARRRIRLTELLLMLPGWRCWPWSRWRWPGRSGRGEAACRKRTASGAELGGPPRDVVLVLDGSQAWGVVRTDDAAGSGHSVGAKFVGLGRPGDSVAVLLAGDRVRPLIDPPAFDLTRVDAALWRSNRRRGSSDLPAALAEAFRILERTEEPGPRRDRPDRRPTLSLAPGEAGRWALLRSLYRRMRVPPRIWSIAFGPDQTQELQTPRLAGLSVSRSLVTPGLPLEVTTTVENAGPVPFSGAAELLVDGQAAGGSPKSLGPVPAGGRVPLAFRTSLSQRGSHLLAVRLLGGDALPADDLSELPVQVSARCPRAAGQRRARRRAFERRDRFSARRPGAKRRRHAAVSREGYRAGCPYERGTQGRAVVVLANVDRLSQAQSAALVDFAEAGGGILVAPGDRTDLAFWQRFRVDAGEARRDQRERRRAKGGRPSRPRSFAGRLMTAFAQGDAPALAEADFFAYHVLAPLAGSAVLARFDTGDPWIVERKLGRGQVLLLATAIDAEAGTLPVNPDFVPLGHEWIFQLAGGGEALQVRPGESLIFPLETTPPAEVVNLTVETPGGTQAKAEVIRGAGFARARFDDTAESGIYRLSLPEPPGGLVFGAVARMTMSQR